MITNDEHIARLRAVTRTAKWAMSRIKSAKEIEDMILEVNKTIDHVSEALKKQDKYRWHDLRKNPEDLPHNGYYDTWAYWHENYQNVRAFYNADKRKWLFHPDNNTGKDWVEGLSIIAWKEIEKFEEEI